MTDEEVWEAANRWWAARPENQKPRPEMLLAEAGGIVRAGWTLPWQSGEACVLLRKHVSWEDLDVQRRAIYGDAKAFKPGFRCCFLTRLPLEGECAGVIGTRVEGRSYGAAFRYAYPKDGF